MSPSALYEKTRVGGRGPVGGGVSREQSSEWMEVPIGGERPFDFSTKGKMRHRVSGYIVPS